MMIRSRFFLFPIDYTYAGDPKSYSVDAGSRSSGAWRSIGDPNHLLQRLTWSGRLGRGRDQLRSIFRSKVETGGY